jgi:hypothetical protein
MADWTTPSAIHSKCGESSGYEATKSIDDDTGTRWQHTVYENHWIIYDMDETKRITKVRLYLFIYPFGRADGFYVYVGDDPANLGDAVWEGTLGDGEDWYETGSFDKNGRYIKLLSKSNEQYQLIYEFDAYAEAIAAGGAKTKTELTLLL